MANARVVIDPATMDETEIESALNRLPAGTSLTLLGSAVTVEAMPGAERRLQLRLPPKVTWKPAVDQSQLRRAATAVPELLRLHREVMERLAA